jgi:hypothetical protein
MGKFIASLKTIRCLRKTQYDDIVHWQAAQKTERKSESEIAMCDRMQMYNIQYDEDDNINSC